MSAKFHVAVFCSEAAYDKQKAFYARMLGAATHEGDINDGHGGHRYYGSVWETAGYSFGLLKNPALKDSEQRLAHTGLIFNTPEEFEAEIKKRGIDPQDPQRVTVYYDGLAKQTFEKDAAGAEFEFLYKSPRLDG